MIWRPQLVALICCMLTACESVARTKAPVPVIVEFSLYTYPASNSFSDVCPVTNEERLKMLTQGKQYMDLKLDISQGLPVSAFSKQVKRGANVLASLEASHTAHVWDDLFLDYLPPNFFHRVGWIDWYLVRRDKAGKVTLLKGGSWRPFGRVSLLRRARDGDKIIGAWGC